MIKRNLHIAKLKSGYLFPQINLRKREFLEKNPNAQLISLGVGDTTEPLSPWVTEALTKTSHALGTHEGYTGYGPEQGYHELRKNLASTLYQGLVQADEVFISDGAKCDIGRLQLLFGNHVTIAVQDPAYPVYVDGSIMHGVENIHYLKCSPENDFFPDLDSSPRTDLIYFCSPNNPTGAVASRTQLEKLVAFAKKNRSIIIFDSAYAHYIKDENLPKSIYEIDGARDVAIETSSFSKLAGFTGVRLGWTVVPENLKYEDGSSVRADWNRITSTIFNGASNIAQMGGLAVLENEGMQEAQKIIDFYLENAQIIKRVLEERGYDVFGGVNAPYLWVHFKHRKSWDVFQDLLEKVQIVATPGSGFGSAGEGFMRFSAFGARRNILEAAERLRKYIG